MSFTQASRRFTPPVVSSEFAKVSEDIRRHTLDHLSTDLTKVVCLASMRDYNTGQYHHDGLAGQYSEELAARALETCHREIFEQLLLKPLGELVDELEHYFAATGGAGREAGKFWEENEPYRVLVPRDADPVARKLFVSNIRIALAVAGARWEAASPDMRQSA